MKTKTETAVLCQSELNTKPVSWNYDWQEDGEAETPTDICGDANGFCFLEHSSAKMGLNATNSILGNYPKEIVVQDAWT